ncbi:hypothetical protein [Sodalis ligni]|uniref:DUF1837 domain-containing protein n=1 Tax=Sodalis ligni TaxID=2697027 RepID=A0A4R1NF56_9GAMM|nr:hypothetical protein [Sodalis ligni]TCL06284.1 hypothetical protein EZJ58_4526 [Sodalis ligni]
MIRLKKLNVSNLDTWLTSVPITTSISHPTNYSFYLRKEERSALISPFKEEVIAYVDETFDDARTELRVALEDDLSPFDSSNDPDDPAANYPSKLNKVTQQGYFGEILGALAVEHWGAAGKNDWQVPAMLFRYHTTELQHLASINERISSGMFFDQDDKAEMRPGRTGDDALAFRLNDQGVITDILSIEAKCLGINNNDTLQDAHKKISTTLLRNSGFRELIAILKNYDQSEAKIWYAALLNLWKDGYKTVNRYNCVSYAVGAPPKKPASKLSWMDSSNPHPAYTISSQLIGLEFHFSGLDDLIKIIFRENNGK